MSTVSTDSGRIRLGAPSSSTVIPNKKQDGSSSTSSKLTQTILTPDVSSSTNQQTRLWSKKDVATSEPLSILENLSTFPIKVVKHLKNLSISNEKRQFVLTALGCAVVGLSLLGLGYGMGKFMNTAVKDPSAQTQTSGGLDSKIQIVERMVTCQTKVVGLVKDPNGAIKFVVGQDAGSQKLLNRFLSEEEIGSMDQASVNILISHYLEQAKTGGQKGLEVLRTIYGYKNSAVFDALKMLQINEIIKVYEKKVPIRGAKIEDQKILFEVYYLTGKVEEARNVFFEARLNGLSSQPEMEQKLNMKEWADNYIEKQQPNNISYEIFYKLAVAGKLANADIDHIVNAYKSARTAGLGRKIAFEKELDIALLSTKNEFQGQKNSVQKWSETYEKSQTAQQMFELGRDAQNRASYEEAFEYYYRGANQSDATKEQVMECLNGMFETSEDQSIKAIQDITKLKQEIKDKAQQFKTFFDYKKINNDLESPKDTLATLKKILKDLNSVKAKVEKDAAALEEAENSNKQEAIIKVFKEKTDRIVEKFKARVDASPHSIDDRFHLAEAYAITEQYAQAITEYDRFDQILKEYMHQCLNTKDKSLNDHCKRDHSEGIPSYVANLLSKALDKSRYEIGQKNELGTFMTHLQYINVRALNSDTLPFFKNMVSLKNSAYKTASKWGWHSYMDGKIALLINRYKNRVDDLQLLTGLFKGEEKIEISPADANKKVLAAVNADYEAILCLLRVYRIAGKYQEAQEMYQIANNVALFSQRGNIEKFQKAANEFRLDIEYQNWALADADAKKKNKIKEENKLRENYKFDKRIF